MRSPLKIKENDERLSTSPVSPFLVSVSLDFTCTSYAFFPERLSNQCQGLRRHFLQRFAQHLMLCSCRIHEIA
jgi:hypothetical protein